MESTMAEKLNTLGLISWKAVFVSKDGTNIPRKSRA